MLAHELRALASLGYWVLGRRHGVGPGQVAISYHAGGGITMWLFLFGIVIEGVALELWLDWPILTVMHVYLVLACLGMIAAARARPHVVDEHEVRLRQGAAFDLRIPRELIVSARAGSRIHDSGFVVLEDGRLDLVVDSRTNVVLELAEPVTVVRPLGRTGEAGVIRLFADDPREFLRTLSISAPPARHGSD
ncbi:hypothetical protein ACIBEJ_36880 [Nonomuraea sp. NPDC050790]|uniref:hypothetical protein n=1 Tax=Nonomuraea sp. NPDC050790 TaxID=3364371 RepID=UPI0037BC3A14